MPIAKASSGGVTPVTAGVHQAVCYSVIDLGTQPSYNPKFPARHKVLVSWEIPGETINIEGQEKPRTISKDYTLSLGKKSILRAMLESWRGRGFTEEELAGFDLKNILGKNCLLNVIHERNKTDPAKVYSRVNGVMSLPKGMPVLQSVAKHVLFDIPESGPITFTTDVPEWICAKIANSEEYRARTADPATTVDTGDQEGVQAEGTDEDVPFNGAA